MYGSALALALITNKFQIAYKTTEQWFCMQFGVGTEQQLIWMSFGCHLEKPLSSKKYYMGKSGYFRFLIRAH